MLLVPVEAGGFYVLGTGIFLVGMAFTGAKVSRWLRKRDISLLVDGSRKILVFHIRRRNREK